MCVAPEKVRLERDTIDGEGNVDRGERQAGLTTEFEEVALQLPAGALVSRIVLRDGYSQPSDSSPPTAALNQLPHGGKVEDPLDFRLGDRVAELVRGDDSGEVEQGPRHARTRNAALLRPVDRAQGPVAVRIDAIRRSAAAAWGRDVDPVATVASKSPEGRSGAMREDRVRATGDRRSHSVTVLGEQCVPDGVYALMNRVQPPRGNALVDEPHIEPHLNQLPQGDHSMLPLGQIGNRPVSAASRLTGRFTSI
jgi:hypothetical protein